MQDSQKPRGLFYGWVMVLTATLVMAVIMGIVYNCFSQFIKPVCADLGFSRQAMSFSQTLISLVQVAVALFWGKILSRLRLKPLMLCWAIIGAVSFFSYSMASQLWQFYVLSALMSVTMSMLTVLPYSYIISNWFIERRGLAIGIAFMGSGIGGMIFNPLLSMWIESYGWRAAFRILGIIMGAIAIPCVLLIKERPEQMGLKALGADKLSSNGDSPSDANEGISLSEAKKTPRLWVLAMCMVLVNIGLSSLVQTLSPHLTDNGYTPGFAAAMVSVSMAALAVGKIILGQLFDMWGTKRTALFSMVCGFLGLVGMMVCKVTPALALIVIGIGFGCSYGSVANPIVVQSVFGKKDYSAILGIFTACGNIGGAISPTANGTSFDMFGSYRPAYIAWAAATAIVFACYLIFLPSKKGQSKT